MVFPQLFRDGGSFRPDRIDRVIVCRLSALEVDGEQCGGADGQ